MTRYGAKKYLLIFKILHGRNCNREKQEFYDFGKKMDFMISEKKYSHSTIIGIISAQIFLMYITAIKRFCIPL